MTAINNIAAAIAGRAQKQPQTLAMSEARGLGRGPGLTFRELQMTTDALAHGLASIGITRGTRTIVMVPPSVPFYQLTFALFKIGAVLVAVDPGLGLSNLSKCLDEAEPEAFIGIPKAHVGRLIYGWGKRTLRHHIAVGTWPLWGTHSLAHLARVGWGPGLEPEPFSTVDTEADELCAILFTSGSTGVAKGVRYTHALFREQVRLLQTIYQIQPGEVDIATFPLFGLYGPTIGMTSIIPEMNATQPAKVDPTKILNAIRYFKATNLFGSPALIRRVGSYGAAHGIKLPSLKRVISAGAPVPMKAIARFTTMLAPGVQVHTPYGATECLPVASIGSDEILGETGPLSFEGKGVCIGRTVPDLRAEVIGISDEPIPTWSDDLRVPEGTIGEIVVRGPVVTRSYYNRDEQTRLAKIEDPAGGFWHRMGDLGYRDGQGRLWFCGRKSQRVIGTSQTWYTIPCEGVFNAHPAVLRTALVGVKRDGEIEPVLCVERDPEGPTLTDTQLRDELLALGAKHEHTQRIRVILLHPSFPVDIRHNSKIFREKLAVWAVGQTR